MTLAEYIQIISTALALISVLCSLVVCLLTFKTTRPSLKIKISKTDKVQCVYHSTKDFSVAFVLAHIRNNSNVIGEVSEVSFKYNNVLYHSKSVSTIFSIKPNMFEIIDELGNKIDFSKFVCDTPKKIQPYSEEYVGFIFPNFAKNTKNSFITTLRFTICGKFFKRNLYRVRFFPLNRSKKI